MNISVEATYENGVLKLEKPVPLKDHQRVHVTIATSQSPMLAAYGVMGFKGTPQEAERFALDPELDPLECP